MKASATINGLANLARIIKTPTKAAEKSTRRGIQAGAKAVLQAQKSAVPVRTGLLKKALGVKIRKYKLVYLAIIGVRRGFRVNVKKDLGKNRILAAVLGGKKAKEIKLRSGAAVGQVLNPVKYGHLQNLRKGFVTRSLKVAEKATMRAINDGLLGDLK